MPVTTPSPLPSRANDLTFGLNSEHTNLGTLQTFLNTTLNRNADWSVFDFSNTANTIHVELKTRRIRHDQYPTAIIGANKVDWCTDPTKDYYFAYCYSDGIFVIKYDRTLFNTFRRQHYLRGERIDTSNNESEVVFIPHEHLRRVSV